MILASGLAARAAEIRLKSACECRGSLVRLGDIAEIRGVSTQQQTQLARLELLVAPPRGTARVIRQGELRELLTQHGIDLPTFQFAGAEQVSVRLAGAAGGANSPADETTPRTRSSAVQFVVPTKTMARGETVRAADVELKSLPAARRGVDFATRPEDVVGRQVTRQLDVGQPIESGALQQPQLVHRSEIITVTARAPGVHIRTSAKALEDGAHGDLISVETLEKNKQKYLARVVGQQQAEVYAGVQTVSATTSAGREPPP